MSKYRSLSDVYGDNAFKPVPKLQRQIVNEQVKVYFKPDTDPEVNNTHAIASVTDEDAVKLKKTIFNRGMGVIKTFEELLQMCGWYSGSNATGKQKVKAERKNRFILQNVLEIVEKNTNVNLDGLTELVANKNNLKGVSDAIAKSAQTGENINLIDLCYEVAQNVFTDNVKKTLEELMEFEFKSGVSVGAGELCISLFSDSKKGKKGDLFFNDLGEVEIKGTDGRPGKKGDAIAGVKKIIPKIYQKYGVLDRRQEYATTKAVNEYTFQRDKLKNQIIDALEIGLLNFYKSPRTPLTEDELLTLRKLRNDIESIDQAIEANRGTGIVGKTYDQIKNELSGKLLRFPKHLKENQSESILKNLKEFFKRLNNYNHTVLKSDKSTFKNSPFSTETILDFLNDNQLGPDHSGISIDDKIEGLLSLKSVDNIDNKDAYKEALKIILSEYNDILVSKGENNKASKDAELLIGSLVGSLQTAMYAKSEKFNYILFFNNGSYNAISFDVDDDTKENFENLFSKFYSLAKQGRLKFKLSLDPQVGKSGINITYKGE